MSNPSRYIGWEQETRIGTLKIEDGGNNVIVVNLVRRNGDVEELHSGSDGHHAYLYMAGFGAGLLYGQ